MRSRDDLASHLRNEHLDLAAHNVRLDKAEEYANSRPPYILI